jgi:hypothetical protein
VNVHNRNVLAGKKKGLGWQLVDIEILLSSDAQLGTLLPDLSLGFLRPSQSDADNTALLLRLQRTGSHYQWRRAGFEVLQ